MVFHMIKKKVQEMGQNTLVDFYANCMLKDLYVKICKIFCCLGSLLFF